MLIRIIYIYINTEVLKVKRRIKKYNVNTNEKEVGITLLISDTINYICKEGHNNDKMYILLGRYDNCKFVFT